jgi:glycosyltransferase involved in cell wall biosynthesis
MSVQRIAVCEAQVPFVKGGAEYLVRTLVQQLRARGYDAERVSIPFKWYPKEELLSHAAAWRLVDLSEANGRSIDLAIGTKFPTYFVRHPNKVVWLVHQHRAAYELIGTPYSDFTHVEADVGLRETLLRLDRAMLEECQRLFAIAQNISDRLATFNGLEARTLYHPPPFADRIESGPSGDYVLFVSRLEGIKRPDLAVQAMRAVDRPLRLLLVGDGSDRARIEKLVEALDLGDRISILGSVAESELVALYKGALAVLYTPYDEDFGYVTLEAFLAQKPLVTVSDAGGPLEFVEDGVNGCVCEPAPEALASALNRLAADRRCAARLGEAGYERARLITWDGVIEALVQGYRP